MDNSTIVAIATSVCTASSTAGVAIPALVLSNKRIDRVEAAVDKVKTTLEMLTGSLHDIDKRLSIIEDRIGR
jgi:biopolymer transport protein ExbB/TolQ